MSEMDAPPKMEQFWEDSPGSGCQNQLVHSGSHSINQSGLISGGSSTNGGNSGGISHQQYERNLNFATGAVEDNEYGFPKKKTVRDPLSHRIIEKRRRDRMNNCLADLARLLPPSSLRKGRGRIEKTEIVELAIKHLRHLQCHPCPTGEKCEFNYIAKSSSKEIPSASQLGHSAHHPTSVMSGGSVSISQSTPEEHFRLGFHECMSETMHFLVEEEGMYPGDGMCVRILQHLRTHSENLMRDLFGKDGKLSLSAPPKDEIRVKSVKGSSDTTPEFSTTAGSNGSTCSGYQPNGSSSGSDGNGGQDAEANETFALPVPNVSQHRSSVERDRSGVNIEYDGENSCCSTQLSLDISDVFSVDSKNTNRSANAKPPIPAIICSSSSVHSSPVVLSSSNGRSSDEGQEGQDGGSSSSNSQHRYKFKNNIKQRFNADQVIPGDYHGGSKQSRKHATKASLKQNEESPGDAATTSDMEEEEAMKLRNSSPVEMLREDCTSRKNFKPSTRRNSTTCRSSTGALTISTSSQTSVSRSPSRITPDYRTIATSTSLCDTLIANADIKLSREELEKSLTPLQLEKSPIPLILDAAAGQTSPILASTKSVGVPAFALHDKGLYYVPLTIDKSILSPYLAKLEPNVAPPLHPVTISVCFLLSPAETKLRLDLDSKALSPALPISSKITKGPHDFTTATIPLALPIAAATAAMKVPKISSNSNRDPSSNSNFVINRFSQSRQYSPASYRYPMSSNSSSCISLGSSHSGSGANSHSPYHPPGYYMAPTDPSPGHHSLLPLPPTHITAGYGSSSSSSSSSGGNPSRANRKRSVCNVSPMSGSSSLGYHSLHDKYAPSAQDFYGYPVNTHSSTTHSHIHSSSGSSSGSSSFSGHHHSSAPYGYNSHGSSASSLSGHMVSMHDDKSSNSPAEAERNKRSCSPSKRVKRSRDGDETLKPKPLPIGLPIIPLPHNETV